MGLPLLCLIAAPPHSTHPPSSPILTFATTPTLSLCVAGPWLTPRIQGSGSGQQTPSQLGGCPEELMQERRKRPRDPSDVPESFQRRERLWCVYNIFNLRREGATHRLTQSMTKERYSV